MSQMVTKAKADCNQDLADKNIDSMLKTANLFKEYINLVEEERLGMIMCPVEIADKKSTKFKAGIEDLEREYTKFITHFWKKNMQ
jgi:hypothetical protein